MPRTPGFGGCAFRVALSWSRRHPVSRDPPPYRPLGMEPELPAALCCPGHLGLWLQAKAGKREGACAHSQGRLEPGIALQR